MAIARRIVGLGRAARNAHNLKTRQPLASVTLILGAEVLGVDLEYQVDRMRDLVLDELNVKDIRWAERRSDFVHHEMRPNFRILGKRLGSLMPKVKAALEGADGDAARRGARTRWRRGDRRRRSGESGSTTSEIEVRLIEKEGLATAGDRDLLVVLDTQLTPELVAEGRAREVVNRIQTARKDAALDYADRIRVRFSASPEVEAAIAAHRDWIAGETLAVAIEPADGASGLKNAPIDEQAFAFAIEKVI